MTARVLVTSECTPKVSGHIVGVKAIRHEEERTEPGSYLLPFMVLCILLLLPTLIASDVFGRTPIIEVLGTGLSIFTGIGIAFFIIWGIVDMVIQARRDRS